jgi:AAA15 family ATPase/GTPase
MENQHLTYFKVENFKKFDSLEVKDIGQFNLIVGDNNVGKTCLLEALLIEEHSTLNQANIFLSLINRKIIDFDKAFEIEDFTFFVNEHFKKDKEKETLFFLNNKGLEIKLGNVIFNGLSGKAKSHFNSQALKKIDKSFNYPLISFNSREDDILDLYNDLATKKDKENLIEVLKVIFPLILDVEYKVEFKQIFDTFIFSFKDKDEFIPLNYLGDGFKRIFYIILKVLSLKGKRIMIDEIEIGIHHSRQKDFLKNILMVCKELDVQLFATTNSEECEIAFVEALKEIKEEKNGRLISLQEEKNGIKSYVYQIENLDLDYEYRG